MKHLRSGWPRENDAIGPSGANPRGPFRAASWAHVPNDRVHGRGGQRIRAELAARRAHHFKLIGRVLAHAAPHSKPSAIRGGATRR